jgi:hypothetical protein
MIVVTPVTPSLSSTQLNILNLNMFANLFNGGGGADTATITDTVYFDVKEQATASSNENQLRLDLADVQLKNMDFLDQIESLQADLDTSNTKLMTQANEFNDIKNKMQTDINDLETSLLDARSCILSFIHEQEKVKVAMNAQKEAMTALLLGHDATINHNGRLTDSMIELVSKFDGIDAKHAEGKSGGGIMDETDSETEDEEEVYHTPKSGDVNV